MCGGSSVEDHEENEKGESSEKGEKGKMGTAKKFDPNFNGPIRKRSCTDIICCILFIICVAGSIACSVFGWIYGDPYKLIYPTDSDGNICGMKSTKADYSTKPNLMFFDLLQCLKTGVAVTSMGCPTPQVCVENCTSSTYFFANTIYEETVLQKSKAVARADMLCKNNIDPATSSKSINDLVGDEDCAAYYIPTTPVVGRCIPAIFKTGFDDLKALATDANATTLLKDKSGNNITGKMIEEGSKFLALFLSAAQYAELVFKDIMASWYLILVFMGLTMIFAFLWIIIMRWIAGIMVWISIFGFLGLFGFATYWCFKMYLEIKADAAKKDLPVVFTTNFSYYLNLKETWLGLGIVAAVVLLIVLLLMLFLCQRIRIAIELIKEGSRSIGNMIFTLLWPIFPFILQIAVFAYYVVSAVYVATMGKAEFMNNGTNESTTSGNEISFITKRITCEPVEESLYSSMVKPLNSTTTLNNLCNFVKYGGDEYIIPMEVYLLFMFFWLMNFVVALGQMTLAGAFASYYWAFVKPKDVPAFPLMGSFYRCFRYHLGSLAFGSLIIAIIQMIRVFLEYLDHKMKGSENPVAKFILKCLKCCFWCLEKFMKFLNRNAYIMIAVHGKNFCFSAKDAFFLILRNIVRTVVLNKITDFLLFICKLVVVAAAVSGAFFWFSGEVPFFDNYIPSLNFYLTPVILVAIGAYLIASSFFAVYAMAIDTLFLCFLEDLERNDGSEEKPYFMSKGMMKILGKKNKSTVL